MIIQHIDADNLEAKVLLLGKQGENNSHQIVFDYSGWLDFGNGSFILIHHRSGDSEPAPVFVEFENGTATWTVTETDVAHAGRGKAEIKYVVNDKVVKSRTYTTRVVDSLEEIENPSEPWKNWLEQTVEAVDELMENVNEQFAEEKAERSTAFTTEQSDRAQAFATEQLNRATAFNEAQATRETAFNSNISAWGARIDNAVSEAETATANANSATTSANTASAKADQSADNADTATANATEATARANAISEDLEAKVASDYYRGAKGDKGDRGERGLQGVKGDPGYTPQRGVDYWTAEDEAKITEDLQADVDQATADVHAKVDNLRKQVQQNTQRIEIAEAVLSQGDFGWKLETEDSYEHAVPSNAVTVRDESYSFADVVGIGGNTVVWNNLVKPLANSGSLAGVPYSIDGTKVTIEAGTFASLNLLRLSPWSNGAIPINSGHKYLIWRSDSIETDPFSVCFRGTDGGSATNGSYINSAIFKNAGIYTSDGTYQAVIPYIQTQVGGVVSAKREFDVFYCNLTQLYGSGNEPTDLSDPRIKWLKHYAEQHPEYNAGELVSANVDSVESVGANLFDATSMNVNIDRRISTSSGQTYTSAGYNSSAFISVDEGSMYTLSSGITSYYSWYSEKNPSTKISASSATNNSTITAPAGARYVRFDYKADNVDNVSFVKGDTANSGATYGSKGSFSIPEQLQNIKRAGSVYDSLDFYADKWIERVGVVDLGTLDWARQQSASGNYRLYTRDYPENIKSATSVVVANAVCSMYRTVKADTTLNPAGQDMLLSIGSNGNIQIVDNAYTTGADFKQAMQGVLLYYELAEPIEHDISGMVDKSFLQAEPNGTIRFNSASKLPVHNAISFPVNNRQALGV